VISGIDNVPPAFSRLGRVLGAGPIDQHRYITLPAALAATCPG
jgi:NitT/TauT family transport system permease protein